MLKNAKNMQNAQKCKNAQNAQKSKMHKNIQNAKMHKMHTFSAQCTPNHCAPLFTTIPVYFLCQPWLIYGLWKKVCISAKFFPGTEN